MAYTRGWSDGTPAGSRAANQIDDAIREFKVDLHERMDSTFAVDWTADPVVARDEIKGAATKTCIIHGTAFTMETSDNGSYNDTGESGLGTFGSYWAPLLLPPGVTITKVRWLVTNNNAVTLSLFLRMMEFSTALTITTHNAMTTVVVGAQIKDSGALAVLVDATHAYYLAFDSNGGVATVHQLHAVEVTYDCPDSRFTR